MSKASIYFTLGKIDSKQEVAGIKQELDTLPGVLSVSVSGQNKRVAVDFDTTGVDSEKLRHKLEKLGYEVQSVHAEDHIM